MARARTTQPKERKTEFNGGKFPLINSSNITKYKYTRVEVCFLNTMFVLAAIDFAFVSFERGW